MQICTAGAGTAHRMPPDAEYLHIVQAALDERGLRYQVLDQSGRVREWMAWDMRLPPTASWERFEPLSAQCLAVDCLSRTDTSQLIVWEIAGQVSADAGLVRHKPCSARMPPTDALPWLWLGLSGAKHELAALLSPDANRSPHRWRGPALPTRGGLQHPVCDSQWHGTGRPALALERRASLVEPDRRIGLGCRARAVVA